ncbi:MAG: hypothetical protein GY751_24480 [Bacteroidetes bacterium]|nr:hypothetical protein [Bacteroidota bacterium]
MSDLQDSVAQGLIELRFGDTIIGYVKIESGEDVVTIIGGILNELYSDDERLNCYALNKY